MFGRSSTKAEAPPPRLPGYAAFSPADIADAKRRHPDVDLAAYAAQHGLEALGSTNPAGFFAALPLDPQLQFNVLRGTIPGGEQGILFHHVLPFPVSADGTTSTSGTLYGISFNSGSARPRMRDGLSMFPVVGTMIDVAISELRDEGSDDPLASCVGVPCTVAAVLVPEAALLDFTIDNRPKPAIVPHHREKLAGRGLDGWTLLARHAPDPRVLDRLLSPPTREAMRTLGSRPYAKLEVRYGTLVIRVNGYLSEDPELDALSELACCIAAELRAAGELLADRCPFVAPLPAVDWPESGVSASGRFPPDPWLAPLHAYAREHRMTLEDPIAYHRAFPSLAVPGQAFAVMRGTLADGVEGRVAWHTEKSIVTNNDGRNGVLLPAPAGAQATPRAGVRLPDEALNYWIGDGILAVWELRSKALRGDLGDMDALVRRALALRESGVVSIA
jgi:hypothetical protein